MNFIGRKIYFDKSTGMIICDTGEMVNAFAVETTVEQDFQNIQALKDRVIESVGVLKLEYGQYSQDFSQCTGVRVNPITLRLEFDYNSKPNEPVYQIPLSQEVVKLQQENNDLKDTIDTILTIVIPSITGGI